MAFIGDFAERLSAFACVDQQTLGETCITHMIEQEICRRLSEAVEARALTALPNDSGCYNETWRTSRTAVQQR